MNEKCWKLQKLTKVGKAEILTIEEVRHHWPVLTRYLLVLVFGGKAAVCICEREKKLKFLVVALRASNVEGSATGRKSNMA